MDDWKRMIPGLAGASLALGSEGCHGSGGGGGAIASAANDFCRYWQTCDPATFAYASVAACTAAYVDYFNTQSTPFLQDLGGRACVDAYTALYVCYGNLYNPATCIDPSDVAFLSSCHVQLERAADGCASGGGHGAQIEAIATEFCQEYQACEPSYFSAYYGTVVDCIPFMRLDLAMNLAGYSAACVTAALNYQECVQNAYSTTACSFATASGACTAQYSTAASVCGGSVPFSGGPVNKRRGPSDANHPRWIRRRG